jgi:hypothetical protein
MRHPKRRAAVSAWAFVSGLVLLSGLGLAGSLAPPSDALDPGTGRPAPTMRTLEEINAKLNELISAPVAESGQKISSAQGDDGDLTAGVPWPDPRFTDNGDGTVADNLTGLVWDKNTRRFGRATWPAACDFCRALAANGSDLTDGSAPGDWRLPNIRELTSLVDYGRHSPALPEGHPFEIDLDESIYHSSTTSADAQQAVYTVRFSVGKIWLYNNEDQNLHLTWCVRDPR